MSLAHSHLFLTIILCAEEKRKIVKNGSQLDNKSMWAKAKIGSFYKASQGHQKELVDSALTSPFCAKCKTKQNHPPKKK